MHSMRMMHAQEVTELKLLLQKGGGDDKIPPGFEFGQRVYQCMQESPGVSYRELPKWDTKRPNSTGPDHLDIVIADAICHGPLATYIHCIDGVDAQGIHSRGCTGWLPTHSQDGKGQIMKHIGKVGEVDLSKYTLNLGDEKVGQAATYAQGAGIDRSTYNALSPARD